MSSLVELNFSPISEIRLDLELKFINCEFLLQSTLSVQRDIFQVENSFKHFLLTLEDQLLYSVISESVNVLSQFMILVILRASKLFDLFFKFFNLYSETFFHFCLTVSIIKVVLLAE